jgi:hypothetical protein
MRNCKVKSPVKKRISLKIPSKKSCLTFKNLSKIKQEAYRLQKQQLLQQQNEFVLNLRNSTSNESDAFLQEFNQLDLKKDCFKQVLEFERELLYDSFLMGGVSLYDEGVFGDLF